MPKLTIKFDQFGNINSDAVGFTGSACEDATNKILAGLGQLAGEDKKPEYYQVAGASESTDERVQGRW